MVRRFILFVLTVLLLLAAGLMTALFIFRRPTPIRFQTATPDYPVGLPCDEAAHFDARTEWWYYTGFLTGEDGQQYAFELVFFKAYVPPEVRIGGVLPISWIANPLYFAHFALSDVSAKEHVFFEQVNFPQFWAAGAREDRYNVWNGSWKAWRNTYRDSSSEACFGGGEHHLRAAAGRYRLRLDLEAVKPPALHGPEGAGVVDMGRAGLSYYYSYTNLRGVGLLYVDGVRQVVEATAWMDHQWGSWQNHGGFVGWDWFSLRLDDGSDLMLFDFRDVDGSVQPESGGTWIAADGSTRHLSVDEYTIEVLERWTSDETGTTYPVKWHLTVPDYGVDATLAAIFPEQEMAVHLGPIYWEGGVIVDGTVSGVGFVEMTGYAGGGQGGSTARERPVFVEPAACPNSHTGTTFVKNGTGSR